MSTINRWNPVRDMITWREAMDRLLDETGRTRGGTPTPSAWLLPIDAYVTDDAIILKADVPGLKPEELDITMEGDTLAIRGEIKPHTEQNKYLLRERPAGRFERTMTINTPIDNNRVEAAFEDGILTLTLPKAEAVKPRQISIKGKTSNGNINAN